ncbi:DUF1289 domain-containing protein [Aureimonas ureilytica]|uniref:DUF1289 domain-containing protein n=1 Tax=Aureimonas ureilytica TaxID=401562 RepID=UPI0009E81120|nr:DUF1289 domain-containing protein [Aureimonas ureilytica]
MSAASASVSSPCVQICVLDAASGWCVGCGRTIEEIISWGSLSEECRLEIMGGLPSRLDSMEPQAGAA